MIDIIILLLLIFYIIYLAAESFYAARYRCIIKHIVYVNGIRGKSTVTRLIYAGLMQGGVKAYCKTTGTIPCIIDTDNNETEIVRRGRANIKEQLWTLKKAAKEGAEVLVIECMAVNPELQYISQHRMLNADIGVITNARYDHMDVMGNTLEEISNSLCNTVPKNGVCFTSDNKLYEIMEQYCKKLNSKAYLSNINQEIPDFDFKDNVALALDVCSYLGVDKKQALMGMLNYKRDPFSLSVETLQNGAIFVNGLSVNDPISCLEVLNKLKTEKNLNDKQLILLINNRDDRGYRTKQHLELAISLNPKMVWLTGAVSYFDIVMLRRRIGKDKVFYYRDIKQIPLNKLSGNDMVYAIGNVGQGGKSIIDLVHGKNICGLQGEK